jgi:hypothetical protein
VKAAPVGVPAGWRRFGTVLVQTAIPTDWTDLAVEGADAGAIAKAHRHEAVRPTVTIESHLSTEPIELLSRRALARALGLGGRSHVLACDAWDAAGAPGRRIEHVREVGAVALLDTTWLFATGRHRVELVVTRELTAALGTADVVTAIGARIAVLEHPGRR